MKQQLIKQYKERLLNIYDSTLLKESTYDYILILKDQEKDEIINNILLTNYQNFYQHDYLKINIPALRKPRKLLTYQEGIDILNRVNYGTLSITNDIPYCTTLNHFVVEGHIYFHTGFQGYKLNGLNQLSCFHVVEDLGIHQEAATHNHQSVTIYGYLKEVKENKKALLNAFMKRYTPDYPKEITPQMVEKTMILELSIDHMCTKRHYH